jgi:hypothetical protein
MNAEWGVGRGNLQTSHFPLELPSYLPLTGRTGILPVLVKAGSLCYHFLERLGGEGLGEMAGVRDLWPLFQILISLTARDETHAGQGIMDHFLHGRQHPVKVFARVVHP